MHMRHAAQTAAGLRWSQSLANGAGLPLRRLLGGAAKASVPVTGCVGAKLAARPTSTASKIAVRSTVTLLKGRCLWPCMRNQLPVKLGTMRPVMMVTSNNMV